MSMMQSSSVQISALRSTRILYSVALYLNIQQLIHHTLYFLDYIGKYLYSVHTQQEAFRSK